jgi:class 3 adenylate cyclase
MFTDLVNSTAFKELVGEDASLRVLLDYYDLLRREVGPYGGQLWKFLGDGMVASFASAKDAVRAAVAIQRAVVEYNARSSKREQMPEVRIGIDNGDVNVVSLGEKRQDVIGRIVDRCSRICAMAEGRHILVTDDGNALPGWLRNETDRGELKVVRHPSTQWKGGGSQRVRIKEVLYKPAPGRALVQRQDELRSDHRIVRSQSEAYRIAAKLISGAKERLLVAVRTLPTVTGKDKHPGDDVFDEALERRINQFQSRPKGQPETVLMFSVSHTRRDILAGPDPRARLREVERRLQRVFRVVQSSKGRLRLACVEDLANPLVVADGSFGIWVLFKSQAPIARGEPGLGLFSVGQDESHRVWKYMLAQSTRRRPTVRSIMNSLSESKAAVQVMGQRT